MPETPAAATTGAGNRRGDAVRGRSAAVPRRPHAQGDPAGPLERCARGGDRANARM
jgi:hypothetical protein